MRRRRWGSGPVHPPDWGIHMGAEVWVGAIFIVRKSSRQRIRISSKHWNLRQLCFCSQDFFDVAHPHISGLLATPLLEQLGLRHQPDSARHCGYAVFCTQLHCSPRGRAFTEGNKNTDTILLYRLQWLMLGESSNNYFSHGRLSMAMNGR